MARTQEELYKNIMSQPLVFPLLPYVSNQSKTFIQSCLELKENKRISWDDIYKHPLIQLEFKNVIFDYLFTFPLKLAQKLEDKAAYIINDLRQQIVRQKIGVNTLFQKLSLNKKKNITRELLHQFLTKIDATLTFEETDYVFKKFDTDGSQTIEFEELKKWFQDNQIMVDIPSNNQLLQKPEADDRDNKKRPSMSSPSKFENILHQLLKAIVQFNINVEELFSIHDKSGDGYLDESELNLLFLKIDPTLTKRDLGLIFLTFDINRDGTISYKEFSQVLEDVKKSNKELLNITKPPQKPVLQHQERNLENNSPGYIFAQEKLRSLNDNNSPKITNDESTTIKESQMQPIQKVQESLTGPGSKMKLVQRSARTKI